MDPKTKQLVEEAEARAAKATLGPWETDGGWFVETVEPIDGDTDCADVCEILHRGNNAGAFGDHTAQFIAHARADVPALCSAVREQDKRARHAEAERDAFDKRIAELEANGAMLRAKLQELVKDWDWVAGDTELFSPGYREAVTVCSKSIKELIDSPSPE